MFRSISVSLATYILLNELRHSGVLKIVFANRLSNLHTSYYLFSIVEYIHIPYYLTGLPREIANLSHGVNYQMTKLILADTPNIIAIGLIKVADIAKGEVHEPGIAGVARIGSRRPIVVGPGVCKFGCIYAGVINTIFNNTL